MEYISLKKVNAVPADRDGAAGMELTYVDGYKSWCPIEVFERDYVLIPETPVARVKVFAYFLDKLAALLED